MKIYAAGYRGRKPDELKALAERLNAVVIDIRLHAVSPAPQWRKTALGNLLEWRYVHCPALGNLNYKNGRRIEIANFENGYNLLQSLAALVGFPGAFLLLCGCQDAETCHRSVVADLLRAREWSVEEATWEA